jgi:hypothetical protein
MSADKFNSLGGYSVGIPPVPVIDANGNVVTNVLVTAGNVSAANIYAANYYYANGRPFNAGGNPYGPNNSVQYNNSGTFDGVANFTFDNTTQLLSVPSINVSGLSNLGPVGNITITGGGSGYLLTTDGNGLIQWSPPGTGSAISNGQSNVSIDQSNGNVTIGVNSVANVVTFTSNSVLVNGNVTATNFLGNATTAGTVTTNAQPNITSVGTLTAVTVTGNVVAGGVKTNNLLYANGAPWDLQEAAGGNQQVQFNNGNNNFGASINFTFNTSTNILTVPNISANGSRLSSITGANVSGTVPFANVANNVAGANVSGTVPFANVANNVAGANVSGEVSFAAVANSIALANVVGIGNIASIYLDGNVANILHGDGTWSGESGNLNANYANYAGEAFSVSGANVSGTVANAESANTAVTVTANAQPNITSVGTLTSLDVTGNVTANNFVGTLANGNSNISIPVADGNINLTAAGTKILTVTSNSVVVTGDLLPNANLTYNLGSPTQRWKDLYIAGNTIDLNGSTITSDANGITLTNPLGGTFTVVGQSASNTAAIVSGNSSIVVDANSNVNISVAGINNVVVISTDGLTVNGNANITKNLVVGETIDATGNITGANLNTSNGVYANTANITANLTSGNANLGNLATANYVNIANILSGNIANFSGNLTSLNADLGNLATANYVNIANVLTGNIANFSGNLTSLNADLGNLATANYFTGTLTTNAQPNITSVGTLTSLTVSGGANTGNLGTTNIVATGTGSFGANVTMNSQHITGLAEPVNNQDAATKQYVDLVAQGLDPKASVTYASIIALPAYTYNNGASGVGATITATSNGELTLDSGYPIINSRVLIKNETGANNPYNGIYIVTDPGSASSVFILTRSTDFDNGSPSGEIPGAFTFVEHGTTLADTGWVCTTNSPVVMGTTPIVFVQFSGAGSYTAGTGLTLNGTEFSISNTAVTAGSYGGSDTVATFTVNQQGQLTAASNVTITANAANLSGTTLNSNITSSNLTSVGNLTSLTSTGNINFSNTANVALGNVTNVHIDGGVTGYVLGTDGSGNLSWISGGSIAGVTGNLIPLGTPSDSDLTTNVAYNGWTTSTYVTDGLDDLNQVSLNIAGNTFVGNIYIAANTASGPSPLTVSFNGNYIGNPTNYLWNFGDGTTSTVRNPTKTYSNVLGGQFTVTFTAFNVNGTYGGNAANGAKGSTATSTNTNFITLFTPLPIPSFTTTPTSLDTGSNVTLTNTSLYATSYTINYGDGNTAFNPGNSWTTVSHTYTTAANVDTIYGINLTGTNQTAGNAPPYSVTTANTNVKVYAPQSPAFSSNSVATINYLATSGGVISFRNDTLGTPGPTATFGAQQLYNFRWGDGTANSNINIQTGLAGNPGAANITHAFALSSVQQNAATTVSYVANLSLYTGFSTSPFISSNITITVEPEVRANFTGTANTQTDATGYTSNAQVGYLYTDYLGRDRSLFNFSNDTSPNVNFTGNVFNWSWGDTTSNSGVTSRANITHSYLNDYGSPTIGGKTVALQANGTPGTTAQSNTNTKTSYITILANPTAPSNLSSFTNVTIATASQGTSPLLAAGANDNTGGNILANGTAVTRVATTTPVSTSTQVTNANTALTGTLTAYVNNTASGNTTFTTSGNAVGTYSSLVVSADRDLHVANAAVPTGFYKVFSATISNTLASLGNGYNDFQLRHSASGNTNTVGMVKDNLNSAPTLVTTNTAMVTATAGTFRYISGIPYYSATGSPAITVANLELQNFTGQTFRSADPFTVASGTSYEGSGSVISSQTKSLAQIDNSANSMLTGSNVKANIGISTNYSMGNLNVLLNGAVNGVSTLAANIFNVVGTSTTIQLPTKIQMYAGANSGFNEQSIPANVASNTQPAIRVVLSSAGNTPAFSGATNYYVSNAWTGAQTIAGTPEAVVRYGVLKHYAVDLSTGYLPIGPNLATGRSGLQYFTFAFVRPSLANFDIILTTGSTGISGLWVAAPGTTIDTGGFASPTAGWPGPTSTINGWLTGYEQYNGAGVPGNSNTGGNPAGTNGCALTGADVIPLNTQISNLRYTMTLGSQNQANSTGNNILIRIALAAGQTITDLQIGVAT